MTVVSVEITGENGDEIWVLVLAAAHFSALFVHSDGLAVGVADIGDCEVVIEVLAVVEESCGLWTVGAFYQCGEEGLQCILALDAHAGKEQFVLVVDGVEVDQLTVDAKVRVLMFVDLIAVVSDRTPRF